MKTKKILTPVLTLAMFCLVVTFYACKKSSTELTPQEEEQIATASTQSDAESENTFNDVFDNVIGVNNEVGLEGTGVFGGRTMQNGREMNVDSVPTCVTVTIIHLSTTSVFPIKVITDFGISCTGRDGRVRSGKIVTTYSGRLIEPGSTAVTTFDNYRVDSVLIQGTVTIANTGTPPAVGTLPVRQFTIDVVNGRRTRPNGFFTEWNGHRVITQVEGMATPTSPLDDVFTITGNAHGGIHWGTFVATWQSEITTPLRKRFACHWISSGVVKVRRTNLSTTSQWVGILDYGNGTCDANATFTVNGVTHQIILH
jgi:hypothetical protein